MKALGHGYDPDPVGGTPDGDEDAADVAEPGLAGVPGLTGAPGAAAVGSADAAASALTMKRMTLASSTTSVLVVTISTGRWKSPEFCMSSAKSVTAVSDVARPSS